MAGKTSAENGKKGGRPKGAKSASTLEKEAVLKEFRQKILQSANVLFNAQLQIATGQTYLYKIEKEVITGPKGGKTYRNKKPEIVTATWEIEAYLQGLIDEGDIDDENDPAATYYFLTTKAPDNKAIDSLLDRGLGKVTQTLNTEDDDGVKLPLMVKIIGRENND